MMALTSILNPLEAKVPSSPFASVETEDKSFQRSKSTSSPHYTALPSSCEANMAIPPNKRKRVSRSWSSRSLSFNRETSYFHCEEQDVNVQYPPCELLTEEIRNKHAEFRLDPPAGEITSSKRRIPYSSDKKDFSHKTGREAFEVFSYDFNKPGDSKTYTILWDYETGLVRTTAIFKACGFQKTTPAKMLQTNPGLKELCYSITGGALAAQGYWIPYAAAKAVSATFAYEIREALTPVFGLDFVELCIPKSSLDWAHMQISRIVIQQCAEEAQTLFEKHFAARNRAFVAENQEKSQAEGRAVQQNSMRNRTRGPYYAESDKRESYPQLEIPAPKNIPQYRSRPSLPMPPHRTGIRPVNSAYSSSSSPFSSSLRHHHLTPLGNHGLHMSFNRPSVHPRLRPTLPNLRVLTQEREQDTRERIDQAVLFKESPIYPLSVKTPDSLTSIVSSASSSNSYGSDGSHYSISSATPVRTVSGYEAEDCSNLPWEVISRHNVQPLAPDVSEPVEEDEDASREALMAAAILMQGVKEDMERAEEKRRREARTRELERELDLLKKASKL